MKEKEEAALHGDSNKKEATPPLSGAERAWVLEAGLLPDEAQ